VASVTTWLLWSGSVSVQVPISKYIHCTTFSPSWNAQVSCRVVPRNPTWHTLLEAISQPLLQHSWVASFVRSNVFVYLWISTHGCWALGGRILHIPYGQQTQLWTVTRALNCLSQVTPVCWFCAFLQLSVPCARIQPSLLWLSWVHNQWMDHCDVQPGLGKFFYPDKSYVTWPYQRKLCITV
jgi:hypothetical protein